MAMLLGVRLRQIVVWISVTLETADGVGALLTKLEWKIRLRLRASRFTLRNNFNNYGADFINYENRHSQSFGRVTPRWP